MYIDYVFTAPSRTIRVGAEVNVKMARALKLILLVMTTITLTTTLLYDTSGAATGNGTVTIGHITYAKGQVLVRSKGRWMRLPKTPWPLYATDRVVTKSGRTSITLVDGGIVRMNVDTSLRLIRRDVPKGFLSSAMTRSTEVNVLVGNVWFHVELKRGKKIQFRTPSMTAAIRGTEGDFSVDLSGNTNLDLEEGKTANTGAYATNPSTADTKDGTSLESSSPRFLDSRQIKAVDSAVQQQDIAGKATARSLELEQKSKTETSEATTKTARTSAVRTALDAALARSAAALARARANMSATKEEIVTAETLQDHENAAAAQESMDQARRSLALVTERDQAVQSMAESADFTTGFSLTTILSALLTTMAYSTEAHSASVLAYTMAVLGHSAGDTSNAVIAETEAGRIDKDSSNVDSLRTEISKMLMQVSGGMDGRSEQAMVTASLIAAEAASVFAADALTHANVAVESVSGDTASLAVAKEANMLFVHFTDRAHVLTRDLSLNVQAGNTELLDEALSDAQELSDAADELSGKGETPEVFPVENPLIEDIQSAAEDDEAARESETQPPVYDIPVLDPSQGGGGTGDRNVSPYKF